MAEYAFVTTWRLAAPIEQVWEAIFDVETWPNWWPSVERAERLEAGDESGVGALWRYVWTTKLPYRLRFDMRATRVEPPTVLEGTAEGELEGEGRWELSTDEEGTVVRYYWTVRTTEWWMNLLSPIARPLFTWNHDAVMREGGEGLARLLNARLLENA